LQTLLELNARDSNFLIKNKNFSYNYVFRNFKKTLMSTYRTTTS
jgi:hypothetical protein